MNGIRRFSGRELLRLQGFPEDFKIVVNITQLRKQTGNSVAVPVVRAIARKMQEAMRQRTEDRVDDFVIRERRLGHVANLL